MSESNIISHYCERTAAGLWNEPLNALTNLAFVLAAVLAWRLYRRNRQIPHKAGADLVILIILLFCIATGSTLWHTLARPWAELADSIPILLFISIYLVSFLWRILHINTAFIVLIFALFQLLNNATIFLLPRNVLNGSLFYVPTWLTLLIFTLVLAHAQHPAAKTFISATLLFSAALVFRSIDQAVCGVVPVGTHFVWHLLIAMVLYLVFSCLICYSGSNHRHVTQRE